jgi:muconolactone delta-isomerase
MDFDNSTSIQAQENEQSKTDLELDESEDHTNIDDEVVLYRISSDSPEKRQLRSKKNTNTLQTQDSLLHVIQFCHLCSKGKVTPVLYSLSSSIEIENWFRSLPIFIHSNKNLTQL